MASNHVRYSFQSEPMGDLRLIPQSVRLVEALNEPYCLEVRFTCDDPDADLAPMLGRDCVLSIQRGENERRVCGLVRHLEEGERTDHTTASVLVVPAFWMLGLRQNTRIFQGESVPDILEKVLNEALGPYQREVSVELSGSYPVREYCVQYQETDLDFAHRLMEEEGISYAFDHRGDVELLVLRDRNEAFPELDSGALVDYQPHNFEIGRREPINAFIRSRTSTTTSVVVGDWDWTKQEMPVASEAQGADELGRERESYEHGRGRSLALWDYDEGLRAYQANDAARQAQIRQEEQVRDALVCRGIGRVVAFEPGAVFELSGHPELALDGRYLIVRVEHVSRQPGDALEELGGGDAYRNRFECIPIETVYRPERHTPKPAIHGVQTAVVTGSGDAEIHTDEHGRIKVQFHWDREGRYDDASSCWIRVQQAWAGAGWGFWYLPRVGMEVVVQFVDGDPDRPLVTGCLYNASNLLPYALPDEKTKSTIKSNSSPGGGGFNELRFEDKAGSEEIYVHAQKDYNEVVQNCHSTHVGRDQTITIENDQAQEVGRNQKERVEGNQSLTVAGNRSAVVKAAHREEVAGDETRRVGGAVKELFQAAEVRSVGVDLTEAIGSDETRTIGGDRLDRIDGDQTRAITGSATLNVMGSVSETAMGGVRTETPANYDITAAGGYAVTAAGGVTIRAEAGIQVAAPGGIQVVDSYFNWVGASLPKLGGGSFGLTLLSLSLAGATYSATGVQVGATLADISSVGIKREADGLALEAAGLDLQQGAIDLWSGFRKK